MRNLIQDISSITTIPESALNKLVIKSIQCICNDVNESSLQHEDMTEVNIGIGTLFIKRDGNEIMYKFIPSDQLGNTVKKTLLDGSDPLTVEIEKSLKNKILNAYKDLI